MVAAPSKTPPPKADTCPYVTPRLAVPVVGGFPTTRFVARGSRPTPAALTAHPPGEGRSTEQRGDSVGSAAVRARRGVVGGYALGRRLAGLGCLSQALR